MNRKRIGLIIVFNLMFFIVLILISFITIDKIFLDSKPSTTTTTTTTTKPVVEETKTKEEMLATMIEIPDDNFDRAEADAMKIRMTLVNHDILQALYQAEARFIFTKGRVVDEPSLVHLIGQEYQGIRFEDASGIAYGKRAYTQIGRSRWGGTNGGATELHEVAHVIDRFLMINSPSSTFEFREIVDQEKTLLFPNHIYFHSPIEFFAEAFNIFMFREFCAFAGAKINRAPLTIAYFENFVNNFDIEETVVGSWRQ
jgi:hypothetical protein